METDDRGSVSVGLGGRKGNKAFEIQYKIHKLGLVQSQYSGSSMLPCHGGTLLLALKEAI